MLLRFSVGGCSWLFRQIRRLLNTDEKHKDFLICIIGITAWCVYSIYLDIIACIGLIICVCICIACISLYAYRHYSMHRLICICRHDNMHRLICMYADIREFIYSIAFDSGAHSLYEIDLFWWFYVGGCSWLVRRIRRLLNTEEKHKEPLIFAYIYI